MPEKRPRGRPKNIKVKINDLSSYLENLPENSPIRQNITPDILIIVNRYIEELSYLETTIKRLKEDVYKHGEVEEFIQGKQRLRRVNPSLSLYFDALRAYKGLLNKINDLIRGVDVF